MHQIRQKRPALPSSSTFNESFVSSVNRPPVLPSKGEVVIDWVSDGRLGDERAMATLVATGKLDGGGFSATGLEAAASLRTRGLDVTVVSGASPYLGMYLIWWAHQDLNLEPTNYEFAALTD